MPYTVTQGDVLSVGTDIAVVCIENTMLLSEEPISQRLGEAGGEAFRAALRRKRFLSVGRAWACEPCGLPFRHILAVGTPQWRMGESNELLVLRLCYEALYAEARRLGCDRLIGPVDASFWIRYRLKTNCFDQLPYTGEPYNLSYYEGFFLENGFRVSGEYVSNRYGRIPQSALDGRNVRRLQYFAEKGYTISSLERESFEKTLREIYRMMISLYSGFQTFSHITEEEFCKLYSPLKKAADPDMVKIAYLNGKAVGFFVTLPNYGNAACGILTPSKLWRICKVKRECKDYILLYLGTEPEHLGLGKALSECLLGEMCSRQAVSMGALIRKGKVTGSYFSRLIEKEYTYALYEKAL